MKNPHIRMMAFSVEGTDLVTCSRNFDLQPSHHMSYEQTVLASTV